MSEVNVKKDVSKERGELVRWPSLGTSLFAPSFFRMSPFGLMRQLTEEMDRVFGAAKPGANGEELWSPAIELNQREGKLVVSAELPGLKKEDIKVKVTDDALVLEGERKHEKEEKREGYYHSERSYGHFYRSIPLPEEAETDRVSAEFSNGVLEVSIPIPESKHVSREVPVSEGGKTKTAGG